MEIMMNIKNLFSFLILSTAVPLSASHAMENDRGVHSLGPRAPIPYARNSSQGDINEAIEYYKKLAAYTREVHAEVITELEAVKKLLEVKKTKTKKGDKVTKIKESQEVLRTFLREQLVKYTPSRGSEGVKAAVGEVEWARLQFSKAAYLMRTVDPLSSQDPKELVWSQLPNPQELDDLADEAFDNGLFSLDVFIRYAENLKDFVGNFQKAVQEATFVATDEYTANPAEPHKWGRFVKELKSIQGHLGLILRAYGIDVSHATDSLADVQSYLYQRCIQDPKDQAQERTDYLNQLREARRKEGEERSQTTAEGNQASRIDWLKKNSAANPR